MSELLLIIIMCRVTIQLYYTNIHILLLADGIEFPKRKGIYHRKISVCTKMGWPNYEFSPNKTARYIGFVPHRLEWCDCRRWGEGNELTIRMGPFRKRSGIDLGSMTVRQSRFCSIRSTDPAYAASLCRLVFPTSPKDRDKETQRWNCGTLLERFAFYRLSKFDRSSSIAGMAEFVGGDRLGPRQIW